MKFSTRIPAYKLAALEIKEFIELNGLKTGQALPSEASLAQQLGISRPSLREGMKALESVGVLEARHGEGVFVAGFSFDTIVDNLPYSLVADDVQLFHLLEVRTALEVGMVPRVVSLIPAKDIKRLRQLAARMHRLALKGESFADEDREFHATLFGSLGNPFLNRLVDLFWQVLHRMADTLPRPDEASRLQTALAHMDIVEKLESGDAAGLQLAHERHFEEIYKRMKRQQPEPKPGPLSMSPPLSTATERPGTQPARKAPR